MDVMHFQDIFDQDHKAWSQSWKELDSILLTTEMRDGKSDDIKSDLPSNLQWWPSTKVNRSECVEVMKKIWDNYLDNAGINEICVSSQVRDATRIRMTYVNVYGPNVFTEAAADPIKTLRKDILPRFLASEHYKIMKTRLRTCRELPSGTDLKIPPPDTSLIDNAKLEDFPPDRRFTLNEFFECKILYSEFLSYLRIQVCSENLICLRMIQVFESLITSGDKNKQIAAEEEAWTIYRFFIASGSAYEISLNYSHKKVLIENMALPRTNIFGEVKKSCTRTLQQSFDEYKETEEYIMLATTLRHRKQKHFIFSTKKNNRLLNCLGI